MTFEPLSDLNGKVVVITGAKGAIAYSTAKRLAAKGATIIGLVRRDIEKAEEMYAKLPNPNGVTHKIILADCSVTKDIDKAAAQIEQCDILVNNAGWTKTMDHSRFELLTDDFVDKIFQNNVKGTWACIRAFTPKLKQSKIGTIINLGSASAKQGGGSNIMYSACKMAIESITEHVARVLSPQVRCVCIAPSLIVESDFTGLPFDVKLKRGTGLPLKRTTSSEDVAAAIEAYIMTVRFVTGSIVPIDGGRSL